MKNSILFRFAIVLAFLCLTAASAMAQGSGIGAYGYTSVDYDEETNTVTAYSETDIDYDLSGYYDTYVQLSVTKSDGTIAASGSAQDNGYLGYAEVVLSFAGDANANYTAIGRHNAHVTFYDYYNYYPYQTYYHDEYYLSYYEGQGVYEPWFHFFESPGYQVATIQTQLIKLGKTYDSASTNVAPTTCLNTYLRYYAQAKDYGGNYGKVNEVTRISTVWNTLKVATDATVVNPDSQVRDAKGNVYQKYNQTSTIPGKTLVGTISTSSGPDSEKKLRFTKP